MKKHQNAILRGLKSRIRQLTEQFDETDAIRHNATKGSLREAYLKDFLANFVPQRLGVNSGFITDCRGDEISPQIDLLVFDQSQMPGFTISKFVTLVPIEASVMAIEVKSMLKSEHVDQIKAQQSSVRKMRFAATSLKRECLHTVDCIGIPTFVFALESVCSKEKLLEWFEEIDALEAVCVVGKYVILRDPRSLVPQLIETDGEHLEILHFLARFHRDLESYAPFVCSAQVGDEKIECKFDFGAYLTFDVPYPGTKAGDE